MSLSSVSYTHLDVYKRQVHILTTLVGLNNLVNVALTEYILVFTGFKIARSINEQNVVGIVVSLSLADKDTYLSLIHIL